MEFSKYRPLKHNFITDVRYHNGLFIPLNAIIEVIVPITEIFRCPQGIQYLETPDSGMIGFVFPIIQRKVQLKNGGFLFRES